MTPRHAKNDEAARRVLRWVACSNPQIVEATTGWRRHCSTCGAGTFTDRDPHPDCPDMGEPANMIATIEWLAAEHDVPMLDDEEPNATNQMVMVSETWEPEIWFIHNKWHVRHASWAETHSSRFLRNALIDAVCSVPEV